MKSHNKKYIFVYLILSVFIFAVLNVNVSIKQGIDGKYRAINMPLYVKGIEFLARHYEYTRITKEIVSGLKSDEEKTLAIFKWTHENIKQGIPKGLSVVDDHVLNIVIRGYGTNDQSHDVFTTLCAYANIPAFWEEVYDNAHKIWYPISYVKINGRWCVFDPYLGKYFKNQNGEIASVDDVLRDKSLVAAQVADKIVYEGIPYEEFYHNIKPFDKNRTLRPYKQMPGRRIWFELKRFLGIEKPYAM